MLIRHHTRPHPRDLRVHITDPDATVADLAVALDPDLPVSPLVVDGREVSAATPLDRANIPNGAVVSRHGDAAGPDPWLAPWRLVVTSGPDAGRVLPLDLGANVIGSAAHALTIHDPTVSARHARLTLDAEGRAQVEDLGSRNGTWIDGLRLVGRTTVRPGGELRCGAARLRVERGRAEPSTAAPGAGPGGPRPLHRPPRVLPQVDHSSLSAPLEPAAPGSSAPIGVAAVLGSVAVGAVMVAVLHSWTYGLFALLGPVLLVANAIDGRRRRRKDRRRGRRRRRADLAELRTTLLSRRQADQAHRSLRLAGPARAAAILAGDGSARWERRPGHPDAYAVRVGIGPVPWTPPLDPPPTGSDGRHPADVEAILDELTTIPDAPAGLVLQPADPIAIVGPRPAALALIRSVLVQATVAHGPADLQVAVLCDPAHAPEWDWCAWLPHAHDPAIGSLLAATTTAATVLTATRGDDAHPGAPVLPRRLVIVDDPSGLARRRSPARGLLRAADDASAELVPIVLVPRASEVPSSCRMVLTVAEDATLAAPPSIASGPLALVGTSRDVAADVARRLARLDDPEVDDPGRGLPDALTLASLLGADRTSAPGLGARWRAAGADPAPRAVLGATADGPFEIDLAVDGPHVLVAGTTGSGKSELLRTMVASLAAHSSPDHLTFVLIDFKGGSAFDACSLLPHTTGLVTDLDDHLAQRALRCLDAELRHREQRLRDAGVSSISELRLLPSAGPPLPRLGVVVDEFATLAAELPDFVDALVGVAQRGRSLGVHLVLATQRPAGSVSEHIRANTGLRIALRVQAGADSTDVIDSPAAASLPRLLPGRALVRLGPSELVAVQAALATAPASGPARVPVRVERLQVPTDDTERPAASSPRTTVDAHPSRRQPTELALLVDAATRAWRDLGGAPPRRAWPEPLPDDVAWPVTVGPPDPEGGSAGPAEEPERIVIGLADDPDHQCHRPFAWELTEGPLLAVGLPGSGTTTLAATVVLGAARSWTPDRCHIHVVDLGSGAMVPLAGLPHVGAVIGPEDHERQRRLVADLRGELVRRRTTPPSASPSSTSPMRFLVLDGLGAFRSRWADLEPSGTWERFLEIITQGPAVGIHTVITAEGIASAPHQVVSACRQRLVFRLGERADHGAFGIPASAVPALVPGRAVAADGPTEVHVARPAEGLAPAVARLAGSASHPAAGSDRGEALPRSVGTLPRTVPFHSLEPSAPAGGPASTDDGLLLTLGLADAGLVTAHLALSPGGHAIVAGPPRSGRTTTLRVLATAAASLAVSVVVVTRNRGEWTGTPPDAVVIVDPAGDPSPSILECQGPLLVLVDDADLTADDHPVLARLATDRRPGRHVVAAARADRLRGLYGHWTRELRADRTGVLLLPDPDVDGDLLGVRLPRSPSVGPSPGRGWLTGGAPEGFVQVAQP